MDSKRMKTVVVAGGRFSELCKTKANVRYHHQRIQVNHHHNHHHHYHHNHHNYYHNNINQSHYQTRDTLCSNPLRMKSRERSRRRRWSSLSPFSSSTSTPVFTILLAIILTSLIDSVNCQRNEQFFKERPKASIEVIEGGSVVIHCVVGNQQGAVQWAKDGFVLGFDRSIPGYPSYSMVGNPSEGVHNLRIENARLEDDGEYQCQVGPGHHSKAIRANAKLTVLLKPKSIEISGHNNGSLVEIKAGEPVNLLCSVFGGKPAATLKWFRKNVLITTAKMENDSIENNSNEFKDGLDSSSHHHHHLSSGHQNQVVSKSRLSLTPSLEDNGVSYTCEAHHPALDRQNPLRKSVTISVLYPPGPPEITGYTDGEVVRVGDTLTFVCKSRGGNPLAQLVWYKNDEQVDFSYTTTSGKESTNTYTFIVDSSDNNAVYRCEASSHVLSPSAPKVASVKLVVQFAPSKVTISGPKEAKAGENVTMHCETDRSNPAAELSWVIDGRPVTATNVITPATGGGWTSQAEVTVQITNQDRNMKMFSCYAVNQALGETIVESSVLSVLYPPDPPSIFGYSEGTTVIAGSLQRLTCVSHGGNPLPELHWFKGDTEIKTGVTTSTNGNVVSNELALVTKDSDNGGIYRCEAQNGATGNKSLSTSIRLTVNFPPKGVFIQVKPKVPKANTQIDLVCESASSNPVSEVTWWRDGFMLNGRKDGQFEAPYGGFATRNVLTLNVTSTDDGAVYTCQATNQKLGLSVHDATTLNVLYKPEFISAPLIQFDVVESESVVLNLTAKGNPREIDYKWSKDGQEMDSDENSVTHHFNRQIIKFRLNGPLLNISNVNRKDGGVYKVIASNGEGTTESSVHLNVQYPAAIVKVTELVLADQGKTAYLECQADANPITKGFLSWRKRKNVTSPSDDDIKISTNPDKSQPLTTGLALTSADDDDSATTRIRQTSEGNRSFLIIYNVTREDSGVYDCIANNGIGEKSIGSANLIVKHKPIINRSPLTSKSAGDTGLSARLVCSAEGAPNVSFTWTKEGSVLSSSSNSKSSISGGLKKYEFQSGSESSGQQVDLLNYQSVLIVNDLSHSDYGLYECIARNELGFDTIQISLSRRSAPDTPIGLRILNRTSNSVSLKWFPSFDGGSPQSFRIRYKPTTASSSSASSSSSSSSGSSASASDSSEPYRYSDVFPPNSTQYTLSDLHSNTEYLFSVMALNELGTSDYSQDIVKGATLKESPVSETEKVISQVLSGKAGDIPRLIIIGVSVLGSCLLLLNIVLVVCFVRKRRKKRLEEESDQSSTSKNGTIEMYAPASGSGGSYNNGAITETSISAASDEENKSEAAYSGQTDYAMEIQPPSGIVHHPGISTYLIDDRLQPEPNYYPSQFANYGPDLTASTYYIEDPNYEEAALRKNAYNQHLAASVTSLSGSVSNQVSDPKSGSGVGGGVGQGVPPVPPLRSTNHLVTTFLPMISEEPTIGSHMGHLV